MLIPLSKIGIVLALGLALCACTVPKNDFGRLARQEGLTDVRATGYDAFGCSDDDVYSTGFTALKNGQRVKGVICGGILKGYTVRYH